MERLIQILDDIDDLLASIGLVGERIRNISLLLPILLALLTVQVGGIILALVHPPLALATAILMFVLILYREVTAPRSGASADAP